jgi:hypothetical protein
MGLRDALKRNKAEIALEVDRADPRPGEDVRLRVTIGGELDDKVQGARAGIRCVHTYLVRERDRNSDDHDVDEVWRSVTLHEEVHPLAAQPQTFEVTCSVPEGSPPTSALAVTWEAFAVVDRKMGMDASAEAPLTVRTSADALPAELPPAPPGEGGVRFADLPARVRTGQSVDGVIEVTAEDDVKATGVVVKLTRVRTYSATRIADPGAGGIALDLGKLGLDYSAASGLTLGANSSKIVKKDDMAEVEVVGGKEFAAGATERLPFSIHVPDDAGPTVAVPHAVVEWRLQATVQRRMRRDLDAFGAVGVFNG